MKIYPIKKSLYVCVLKQNCQSCNFERVLQKEKSREFQCSWDSLCFMKDHFNVWLISEILVFYLKGLCERLFFVYFTFLTQSKELLILKSFRKAVWCYSKVLPIYFFHHWTLLYRCRLHFESIFICFVVLSLIMDTFTLFWKLSVISKESSLMWEEHRKWNNSIRTYKVDLWLWMDLSIKMSSCICFPDTSHIKVTYWKFSQQFQTKQNQDLLS